MVRRREQAIRFLIDESADARIAAHLAALGHDVTTLLRTTLGPCARLTTTSLVTVLARLDHVLDVHAQDLGDFIVVTDRRVRRRG